MSLMRPNTPLLFALLFTASFMPSLPAGAIAASGEPTPPVQEHRLPIAHPSTDALSILLAQYEALAHNGGWPVFTPGATIKPPEPPKAAAQAGSSAPQQPSAIPAPASDPRIPTLRQLLRIQGDYVPDSEAFMASDQYDEALQQAVRHFQRRHGLEDDGAIGAQTQYALNTPVEFRIRQIRATMERIAQAPAASARYVVVNIPEFMLRAYEAGELAIESKVVVGTPKNPTPILDTKISYVSLNPTWGVPPRIAGEEMLHKIIEYPNFLSDHHYRVFEITPDGRYEVDPATIAWETIDKKHFPYLLVQDAGEDNALGKIKFGLNNSNGIYMHDTSVPKYFAKDIRTLSHGCVRVEKPRELAYFVFRHMEKYPPDKVDSLYDSNESKILKVDALPVHFVYWTVWVDEQTGQPQFRKDIYNIDKNFRG